MRSQRATSSAAPRTKSSGPPSRTFSRSNTGTGGGGGMMSSTSSDATPTGRIEMLMWLESRCGRSVESIEGLRDGISYAMVLADMIAMAADGSISSKADAAYDVVDHKLERRVGQSVLSQPPSQDSIQVTEACERNLQSLQSMIRQCLPKRHGMEIDVHKMAKGMMQDHMFFLRWLVQLPKKVLTPANGNNGAIGGASSSSAYDNTPASSSVRGGGGSSGGAATPLGRKGSNLQSLTAAAGTAGGAPAAAAANLPSAEPSIIHALLAIQREIEEMEEDAIAKGAIASGGGGGGDIDGEDGPSVTFADVQARQEHRDALSDTLAHIAELAMHSAEKAQRDRMPACPLQLELQRVFAPSSGK